MARKKIELKDVVELTKDLYHEYYSGNPEPWFSHLCNESIWIGNGEPLLFGGDAIRDHFQKCQGVQSVILAEEYHPLRQGDDSAIVCGRFVLDRSDRSYQVTVFFTIAYRRIADELKITHQHNSYEFSQINRNASNGTLHMDMNTTQFVKNLLLEQHSTTQIPVKSGRQTLFINPVSVMYVQSQGKRTELVCADRLISCSNSIGELASLLPMDFYPVHRSYLVNTRYVTALRRFEVQLVSGITIPVPEKTYMKVKKDFQERFQMSSDVFQRNSNHQ